MALSGDHEMGAVGKRCRNEVAVLRGCDRIPLARKHQHRLVGMHRFVHVVVTHALGPEVAHRCEGFELFIAKIGLLEGCPIDGIEIVKRCILGTHNRVVHAVANGFGEPRDNPDGVRRDGQIVTMLGGLIDDERNQRGSLGRIGQ